MPSKDMIAAKLKQAQLKFQSSTINTSLTASTKSLVRLKSEDRINPRTPAMHILKLETCFAKLDKAYDIPVNKLRHGRQDDTENDSVFGELAELLTRGAVTSRNQTKRPLNLLELLEKKPTSKRTMPRLNKGPVKLQPLHVVKPLPRGLILSSSRFGSSTIRLRSLTKRA